MGREGCRLCGGIGKECIYMRWEVKSESRGKWEGNVRRKYDEGKCVCVCRKGKYDLDN